MLGSPTVDSFKQVITFKTLQSDDRGYFKIFVQGLKGSKDLEALIRDLNRPEATYSERAETAFKSPHIQRLISQELYIKKNEKEAEKHRSTGNDYFRSSQILEAFRSYSVGIIKASPSGDTLPKLFGNRSACLQQMGHYEEAVLDIDEALALSSSSPELINKLKERKEECLEKIGKNTNAESSNGETDQNKFNISYGGPSVGRYVSASADLETGESVLSESPVGSILYKQQSGSHCAVCFIRLIAGYPCASCCNIAFCSPSCREKGAFHQFECRYQDFFTGLGLSSVGRLALRLITSKPLEYFLEIKKYLKEFHETKESLSEHAYVNIYNLTGNGDQRWIEDIVHRTFLASILAKTLVSSGYFGPQPKDEDIIYIGSLIHRNLDILQFNAHEVYEFIRKDEKSLKPSKQIPIGLAIYQRASYMNHSCMGSIVRYFNGNKILMKSLHPIQKGEEIFENYGPTFYFKETRDRRKDLKDRYWFNCHCEACKGNWPLLGGLPSTSNEESYHNLNLESFSDLVTFIKENYASGKVVPSELVVRAMDKLRTVCYNMGTVHFLNK